MRRLSRISSGWPQIHDTFYRERSKDVRQTGSRRQWVARPRLAGSRHRQGMAAVTRTRRDAGALLSLQRECGPNASISVFQPEL